MTLAEYLEFTETTAVYPREHALEYVTIGLCSEAGELCSLVKRQMRDGVQIRREDALGECGDVLYYLARICVHLGLTLEEAINANVAKLTSRKERGVLHGKGGER